ncbi:MAG: asparagine synthase (glutamine-hydrolyzing) [Desulfobacterales bacterium]
MCGVAGILDFTNKIPAQEMRRLAEKMAGCMVHRGPDDQGSWVDEHGYCAFSHRRLSIIDTSEAGRQPMESWDRRYCITYNGEIYNFKELKPEIEARGHRFRTKTDTEVLIETLRHFGSDAFLKLDGMYAFAFFDNTNKELLLARDPFGEKPLYYMATSHHFAFASELNALQQLPFFDDSIDPETLAEYLCFQYVGAPRSLYKTVQKIPPGHYVIVKSDGTCTLHQYFEFNPVVEGKSNRSLDDFADELEEILIKSINRRLISDVPLGAFLSGGVDSSTVVALITKALGHPIKTFSIGFNGTDETEHLTARRFAEHLGTEHREKILTPDASSFLHKIGGILDEPNGDSSCLPTYLLSEFARQEVTVAISGDGGDEMFGGYGRYFDTLNEEQAYREGKLTEWTPGRAYFSGRILFFTEPYLRELFGYVPKGLQEILRHLRNQIDYKDHLPLLSRMRKADVENYMPGAVLAKVDRMSMQHSLEVRTPFLNIEVARFAEKLPVSAMVADGAGKLVLKKIARRYLPSELIDAPKKGFGLPMSQQWGRSELIKTAASLIDNKDSVIGSRLGDEGIKRFFGRQRSENGFATYQVWALSVLESYLRHHSSTSAGLPSGLPISELLQSHNDTENLGTFISMMDQDHPVFLFFRDTLPFWWNALPAGSKLVSPIAVQPCGRIDTLQMDWLHDQSNWADEIKPYTAGAYTAWIYCDDFSDNITNGLLNSFERAGFKKLVCSFDQGRYPFEWDLYKGAEKKVRQCISSAAIRIYGHRIGTIKAGRKGEHHPPFRFANRLRNRISRWVVRAFGRKIGKGKEPIVWGSGFMYKNIFRSSTISFEKDRFKFHVLFEDGVPLPFPESFHEEIANFGAGRYSIWKHEIYFSSSDNSDPSANNREYRLITFHYRLRWLWRLIFEGLDFKIYYENVGGNSYNASLPDACEPKEDNVFRNYYLFENGLPLLRNNSSHDSIRNLGMGRYSIWENQIFFSSSDNTDPNSNGRKYYICRLKPWNKGIGRSTEPSKAEKESFRDKLVDFIRLDNSRNQPTCPALPGSKVVLITHALTAGGAERQWCFLARELDRLGYKVTLITTSPLAQSHSHYLSLLEKTNVDVIWSRELSSRFDYRSLKNERPAGRNQLLRTVPSVFSDDLLHLFYCLKHIDPQFAACQLDYTNLTGGMAAWLANVPSILLSTRNVNPSNFPAFHQPWFKEYYQALSESRRVKLTGNSLMGNEDYAAWIGIPSKRFTLIRNGLDTTLFKQQNGAESKSLRDNLGLKENSPILCGVFRLAQEKNPLLFVDVVEKIIRKMPELEVVVAGEGPLKEEMMIKIQEKKLEKNIHLLGRRQDVAAIIGASKVLLLASTHEGTPNVALEAQFLKVPVVAYRVGGVPETLRDGVSGFICTPGEVSEMADRCLYLLMNEQEQKKMGSAGKEFVETHFSMERMVQDTLSVLSKQDGSLISNSCGNHS